MIDHEVLPLADNINLLLARTLLFLTVRQALETEREAALAQRTAVPEQALDQELVSEAAIQQSLSLQSKVATPEPQHDAEAVWGLEW